MRRLTARMVVALLMSTAPVAAEETRPVMKETALAVSGMICSSCSTMVEKALQKLPGVASARADVKADRVSVRYDTNKVTPQQMVETLRKAGYQARWPESPAPQERTPQH
jgi:copper chaperone CopZ